MFDVGFWELTIIVVVGIVVVGPNRLPEVVRTIAITLRKFRRMFSDVKADISRELDLDNMRKFMREAEIEDHIKQLNQSVMDMDKDDELTKPVKALQDDIDGSRRALNDLFNDTDDVAKAKATEQADTGIEPPQPARFSKKTDTDGALPPVDGDTSPSEQSSSSDHKS